MSSNYFYAISKELNISEKQVSAVISLLQEDCTIQFIARYRKEMTGSLDEVVVTEIRDRFKKIVELDKRKEAVLKSLDERQLLTDELKSQISSALTMTALEDIYLPYRPKRKTRASIAIEKGLKGLADLLILQKNTNPEIEAEKYLNPEKGVSTIEEALQGARDIIAELICEDKISRERTRDLFSRDSYLSCKVIKSKTDDAANYKDYFDLKDPIKNLPSHRILAIFRGENEGFLKVSISPDEETAVNILKQIFIKGKGKDSAQISEAIIDGYNRLLQPSMENEMRQLLKDRADAKAIDVFAVNIRELLNSPPLGRKRILAIDPGFRTGCKVVCLDEQGKLLDYKNIFPHPPESKEIESAKILLSLHEKYKIEAVAVGNGTAGRESEIFAKKVLPDVPVIMVNESGASVYSASECAREEFPDYDITVRGAVSIGRRLMDPLAELVKIDPKSIGVGQYQHDVDQTRLADSLNTVVESCVNNVGVELNTASKELLTYVSGLGKVLAGNIIKYRNEKGPFKNRKAVLKVPRLGAKAFEQAAGFLRIADGSDPLDASAVHPESYTVVAKMAESIGCKVSELIRNESFVNKINLKDFIDDKIGMPTLTDIKNELLKPGRDPRKQFEIFSFAEGVSKPEDLVQGMVLPGIVTNVTAFGAFVDIGVHQDGLVHISQLSDTFVSNPSEVVKVQQSVSVRVIEVDLKRKRISLSMKSH